MGTYRSKKSNAEAKVAEEKEEEKVVRLYSPFLFGPKIQTWANNAG